MLRRNTLFVVEEAEDGRATLEKTNELRPHLIVLDIHLPDLSGIEIAKCLRTVAPQVKILFLSQESSPEVVQEALNSGALGYVRKVRAGRELLRAIETVLGGEKFVSSFGTESQTSE